MPCSTTLMGTPLETFLFFSERSRDVIKTGESITFTFPLRHHYVLISVLTAFIAGFILRASPRLQSVRHFFIAYYVPRVFWTLLLRPKYALTMRGLRAFN